MAAPQQCFKVQKEAVPQQSCTKRSGWAVLKEPTKDAPPQLLERFDFSVGPLGADEVDLKPEVHGLCHTDVAMMCNAWEMSRFPMIPGHECVGFVVACGAGVSNVKVGDRVGIGFLRETCQQCAACKAGKQNICVEGVKGTVMPVSETEGARGCFQDVVRIKAPFCLSIPDSIDSITAAPLLCAGVTVFQPLAKYLRPGMRVAIVGVGGLGHLAVGFASKLGGAVTAVDVDERKLEDAQQLGADKCMMMDDFLTCEKEYDLVLDCATVLVDAKPMLDTLVPGGTLVLIGIPGSSLDLKVPALETVFYQRTIAGTNIGGVADVQEMFRFVEAKGITVMAEQFPMAEINAAVKHLNDGKAHYRCVLICQ